MGAARASASIRAGTGDATATSSGTGSEPCTSGYDESGNACAGGSGIRESCCYGNAANDDDGQFHDYHHHYHRRPSPTDRASGGILNFASCVPRRDAGQ
jgi:hypothetical protein